MRYVSQAQIRLHATFTTSTCHYGHRTRLTLSRLTDKPEFTDRMAEVTHFASK